MQQLEPEGGGLSHTAVHVQRKLAVAKEERWWAGSASMASCMHSFVCGSGCIKCTPTCTGLSSIIPMLGEAEAFTRWGLRSWASLGCCTLQRSGFHPQCGKLLLQQDRCGSLANCSMALAAQSHSRTVCVQRSARAHSRWPFSSCVRAHSRAAAGATLNQPLQSAHQHTVMAPHQVSPALAHAPGVTQAQGRLPQRPSHQHGRVSGSGPSRS